MRTKFLAILMVFLFATPCAAEKFHFGAKPGGNDTEVQFKDGDTFGGDSDLVWIKGTARLGIGTTDPGASIHVKTTGEDQAQAGWDRSSGGWAAGFLVSDSNQPRFKIHAYNSADIGFLDASSNYWLYLENGGSVGIGTTNPNAKLTVYGEASLAELADHPSQTAAYGKLYVLGSDNDLYFKDSSGSTTNLLAASAGGKTGPTLIVAASDSKDTSRADYVCDGTDDEVQINQAINALPTAGGTVYLMEGNYSTGAAITVTSNTTLTGAGYGTVIKPENNFTWNVIENSDQTGGNSYITISNLSIDGNRANNLSGDCDGIEFDEVASALINNVKIDEVDYAGISLESATDWVVITKCAILDCVNASILVDNDDYTIIDGNSINNSIGGRGIDITNSGASQAVISNNTIVTAGNDAIDIYSNGNSVTGNRLEGNDSGIGINLERGGNTVTGNGISDFGTGIRNRYYAEKNVIIGNRLYSISGTGIILRGFGTGSSLDRHLVANNLIEASTGISVELSTQGSDENVIEGNHIVGATTGISIGDASIYDTVVRDNNINATTAISDSGTNTLMVGNTISDSPAEKIELSSADTALTLIQSGTGDIVNVLDASSEVFAIADGGGVVFQNQTDSTNAFMIRTAAAPSDELFWVDTDLETVSIGETSSAYSKLGILQYDAGSSINAFHATSWGTGDIMCLADTGNIVFQVMDEGHVKSRNWTNDTAAWQVLNASGAPVFGIDTTNSRVGIGTTSPGAKLSFAADTTAAGGIDFGGDVSLYRSAANSLATNDALRFIGVLYDIGTDNNEDLQIVPHGTGDTCFYTDSGTQVYFGTDGAKDTNLYRSAADELKTDDSFIVDGSKLIVTSGDIGIGITNPSNKLHVEGTGAGSAGIYLNDAVPSSTSSTLYNNGGNLYWSGTQLAAGTNTTGPTLIVAASNSKDTSRADYTCDGTDDQDEIEDAIGALDANIGGTVLLLEGTYYIGNSTADGIDFTKSNVSLIGSGKSTVLLKQWDAGSNDGVITVGDGGGTTVTGVVIANLSIDGQKGTYAGIQNIGIYLNRKVSQSKIQDTWVYDCDGRGIYLYGTSGNENTYNIIEGNDIDDCYNGIDLRYSTNNVVTGNISHDNFLVGLWIESSTDNAITSNISQDNGFDGIDIYSSSNNIISGNVSHGNISGHGIYNYTSSNHNAITGNTLQANGYCGIYVSSSSYITITGNKIHDNGGTGNYDGILLSNSDSNTISSNDITDTSFGATAYAIQIADTCDNNYLVGNRYYATGGTYTISDASTTTIYGSQLYGDPASADLILKPLGDVGIGTTNPSEALEVDGNVEINNILQTASGTTLTLDSGSDRVTIYDELQINGQDVWLDGASNWNIDFDSIADDSLRIRQGGVTLVTIDDDTSGGNVGIGTTNPGQKLEVNGNLYMSGGDILTDRWLTGSGNTLIGENVAGAGNLAHSSGSDGWYNTALGYNALYSNTTGFHNTAVGWNALEDNTTGYYNTAIGSQALMNNTGSFNVAVGYAALDSLSSNSDNVAVGTQALRGLLSGGGNVCVGGDAMTDLTTGSSNVGVGYGVLDNITTTCCNTAVGFRAGLGVSANTFSDNSLFGYQSGLGLTVGNNNVLLGYKSGDSITTGSNNIIIGYDEDTPTATTSNHLNIGGALYGDLSTGNIGIGKTDPNRQLSIKGDNGIGIIHSNDQANYIYTNTNGQLVFGSQSSDDYIWMDDDTGDVGIGTSNPGSKLEVAGTSSTISNSTGDLTITPAGDLIISSGNVGIGTTNPTATLEINGNIKADLNDVTNSNALYATGTGAGAEIGYDVAELFEANEEVEIGDVLVIDENGKLKKSTKSYDSKVAGIVSGAPAILFEGGQLQIAPEPFEFKSGVKPPLALAGRVYVKATAENGLIKPGDLLTTSDRQGYAMLAKEHKPGTILGKALENLNEGEGRILVLVTLQ